MKSEILLYSILLLIVYINQKKSWFAVYKYNKIMLQCVPNQTLVWIDFLRTAKTPAILKKYILVMLLF